MSRKIVVFVALIALTGCASDWETRAKELERENLELIAERDSQRRSSAEGMAKIEALDQQRALQSRELANVRQQYDDQGGRLQEYVSANEMLTRENDELRANGTAGPSPDQGIETAQINAALRSIQMGNPEARLDEDGNIEIPLASDVTFGLGRAALTKSGRRSLESLRELLTAKYDNNKIRVVGHTDNTPVKKTKHKYGDNRGLGSARALEVVRFLERDMALSPARLISASEGANNPVASNKTSAGRAKNRRVEIVVIIPREEAITMAR